MNINQHFSNLVTKAAEQDADTSQLITQRDRLFKDKVIPELVKRQANDTAIAQARNKWNKQTDEVMSNAGLLPKAGQSSRSFAKDKRADKANQEAVKTGSNFPIIKEAIMSTGETIGNLFSQGVGGMIEGAAGFVRDIGENEKDSISAKIAKYGKNLKKDYENSASTFQKELQGGQHGKIPQLSAGAIQSVPAMALPFGAAKGVATVATKVPILASKAPYLGIVAGKAAEHTQNYGEVRRNATANLERDFPTWEKLQGNQLYQQNFQKLLDSGVNINQARQQAHADTLDALSEGAADKYGTAMTALGFIAPSGAVLGSGILKNAPTSRIGKALVGGGVSADLIRREMTQAPRVGMAKLIPDISKTANIAAAKMVGKQALEEGLQGGIGEYGAQAASANIGGTPVDYGKVGQTILEEGLVGGIMGGGMQSGLGGSPTSQAKEVAKQLRNQTNTLRQEEAAARKELAQATQFNDPEKIQSAQINLQNIGAEANKVKAAYGQYGIEIPHFVERFASQYQPQQEPEPEAQQDVDPAAAPTPEAAPQTEPVQPAQPAPAQPTQVNNGMANTTNLVMDSVTKGLISPEEAQAIQTDPILGEVFSLVHAGDEAAAHNIVMNAVSTGNIDMNQAQNLIESIPRYAQIVKPQKPSLSGIVNDHVKQQIQPSQDGGLFSNAVDLDPNTLEPVDPNQPSPFQEDFNEPKQFMNRTKAHDYVRINGLTDSHEINIGDDGVLTVVKKQGIIPDDPNLDDFGYTPENIVQPTPFDPNLTDFTDGPTSVADIADSGVPEVLQDSQNEQPVQTIQPIENNQPDHSKPKTFSNPIKAKDFITENNLKDSHKVVTLGDGRVQVQPKTAAPVEPAIQQEAETEPQQITQQEVETAAPEQTEEPAPLNDITFADQIRDAHTNNPKTKAKLINDEVAKGRPRPEVLKEVADVVKSVNDSKPKEPEPEVETDLSASKKAIVPEEPAKDQKTSENGIQESDAPDSIKSADIGRGSDGKPFLSKNAANRGLKLRNVENTHEVVEISPSNFVLREKAKSEPEPTVKQEDKPEPEQPTESPFQKYDELAKQYGRSVKPDGTLLKPNGQDSSVTIQEKNGRLHIVDILGNLLFTGATNPESLGKFLEDYWYDTKSKTKPEPTTQEEPKQAPPADDIGRASDNAPFANEGAANIALRKKGLEDTHAVVRIAPSQFVLRDKSQVQHTSTTIDLSDPVKLVESLIADGRKVFDSGEPIKQGHEVTFTYKEKAAYGYAHLGIELQKNDINEIITNLDRRIVMSDPYFSGGSKNLGSNVSFKYKYGLRNGGVKKLVISPMKNGDVKITATVDSDSKKMTRLKLVEETQEALKAQEPQAAPIQPEQNQEKVKDPLAFPIDKVKEAYGHAHLSPGNTARAFKESFDKFIQAEIDDAQALATTEAQQTALDEAIDWVKTQYINEALPPLLNAASATVSSARAGRNNFNSKQADQRGSTLDKATAKFDAELERLKGYAKLKVLAARTPKQKQADAEAEAQAQAEKDAAEQAKVESQIKADAEAKANKKRASNEWITHPDSAEHMTMEEWKAIGKDYKGITDGVRRHMGVPVWITDEGKSKPKNQSNDVLKVGDTITFSEVFDYALPNEPYTIVTAAKAKITLQSESGGQFSFNPNILAIEKAKNPDLYKVDSAKIEPEQPAPPAEEMKKGDVGRKSDNQPFASATAAKTTIKKQGLDNSHEVVQLAPSQFVLREKLDSEQEQYESSISDMNNAKQSTPKTVDSVVRDHFLKAPLDDIQHSESGIIHSIPRELMDQVHKLGDILNDLSSLKTDKVKTNVLYDKELLTKLAKLNPDVRVHIVSDLVNSSDPIIHSISDQLQEGGFYSIDSGVSYIYPRSSEWKGTLPELINHELIHAATQEHIDTNKLTPEQLERLEEFKEMIWSNNRESVDDIDPDVLDRINYAIFTSYPHEMFTVFGAESSSREILSQIGILDRFDTIFNNVLKEAANDNGQIKQRSSSRVNEEGASEGVSGNAFRIPATIPTIRTATSSSENIERSSSNQPASLSSSEKNEVDQLVDKNKKNSISDSEMPLHSRTKNQKAQGSDPKQVRAELVGRFGEDAINQLESNGVLTIVPTHTEQGVEGFAENGKVTLVADAITPENIVPVFLHELGGHVGIQGVLKPSAYENLMSDFDRLVKASNPDALEAKRLAERETDKEIQKDEYLPYLITVTAKNQQKQSAAQRLVSRVLGAIKAWAVHKLGLNLKLNSSDILALAERMVKTVAKNPPPTPPKGKLKTDQTETEAFKKWFSDSKVIDESGKPKIVYHGTNQSFNIFNVSDVGIHAGTMDQANSRKGEKNSGEFRVMPLYMRINNPLRLKDSPSWKDPAFYIQKTGIAQHLSAPLVKRITGFYDELKGIDLKTVQGQEQALDLAMAINRRVTKELKAQGYDGIVYKNTHDGTSLENKMREDDAWIVFDPEQIKSATNNNGDFDSSNPDIRYSRSSNPANMSRSKQREFLDKAASSAFGQMSLRGAEGAKTLSNRTLNLFQTMLHKSLTDKSGDFKKTFDLVQGKINHVTFASTRSMDVAPNVLTQLEEGSDYWKEAKRVGRTLGNGLSGGKIEKAKIDKDLEKIGTLLFENTLLDNSERHTDKELRQLGFDDEQIGLYNEVREAIDTSLDTFANTTFSNIYKHLGGTNEEVLELEGLNLEIHAHYNEVLKRINALTNGKPEMADARQAAIEAIDKVFKKANDLKDEGYVPLMRFGKYFVRIYNPTTGEVAYRQHFESESERNMYYRKHANDDFPAGFEMEQGRINELQHKLFQGVSPETVALFAKESGLPIGDAEKAYIKFAVKNNHALKRLLRRQGIDGFDTDLKRVLAAFVMSNARYSANQTYNPAIDDSIVNIKDPAYQEDAIRLRDYSLDTQEELAPVKNFAFVYYMGFSAMFGVVNLTQPFLQTLPFLMQYSKDHGTIFKAMGKAITTWRKGTDAMDQKYKAHYERARKEGHLDPQNTWMMQGLERGKSGLGASTWQLISHASGMFAQASETVNRRTTLFAALDVAESMGQAKLEKLGFKDAYDFAVRTIQETQGIYNKGNRPRVARGNIGSVLMMYKQFMISYIEQMSRMQKSGLYGGEDDEFKKKMAALVGFGISRSVLVMLGILMSVSGATGLPFVRDILDAIETTGGLVGKPVNTEREVQIALHDALGQTLGSAVNTALMDGFVNLNPLIDVKGRMGMGDLIPATAYFSPTTSDYMKSAELANIAGPIGGLIEKVKESVALAQVGAYGQAGVQLLPKAVTSMGQGAIAATTGDYRNMKTGVKTNDATVLDGIIKAFDAQPASIAKEGRIRGLEMKDKAAKTAVNARWKERYEAALDSGERASISAVKQEIKEYNQENPRYPVTFNKKTTETNYKKSNQKWQDKRKDAKGLEWMDAYNPYLSEE